MTESELLSLISQGESDTLDFKLRVDSPKKIAITLSAFANSYGGTLLVGVKDNGKISGLKAPDEEVHVIDAAAQMYCDPKLTLSYKLIQIENKKVLIAELEKQPTIVKACNTEDKWRAYTRVQDENFMMNTVLLRALEPISAEDEELKLVDEHLNFLHVVNGSDTFGFNKARKLLKLNNKKTEVFLAQLLRWKVINYQIIKGKTVFFIDESFEFDDHYQ